MPIVEQRIPDGSPILGGKYRVDRRLGAGDMDEVYAATTSADGTSRAIRVVWRGGAGIDDADWAAARAAVQSALTASQAIDRMGSSAHIVRVHDVVELPGALFMVLDLAEFAASDAIQGYVFQRGMVVPGADVQRWTRDAAVGLKFLHDAGWVHGAIRPSSVLVFNGDARAALGALQNARPRGDVQVDATGQQVPSDAVRSDIRALGTVAYALLTGTRDVPSDAAAELARVRPDVSPQFLATVLRMVGLASWPPPAAAQQGSVTASTQDARQPLLSADAVIAALDAPHAGMVTPAPDWGQTVPAAAPSLAPPARPTRQGPVPMDPVLPPPHALVGPPREGVRGTTAQSARRPATKVWQTALAASVVTLGVTLAAWRLFRERPGEIPADADAVTSAPGGSSAGDAEVPSRGGDSGVQIQVSMPLGGVPRIDSVDLPPNPFDPTVSAANIQTTDVDIDPRVSRPVDLADVANLGAIDAAYELHLTDAEHAFLAENRFVLKPIVDIDFRPFGGREFEGLYAHVRGSSFPRERKPENSILFTSDLYLHTYQLLYSELVREIEFGVYFPALKRISEHMMKAAEGRMEQSASDGAERSKWAAVRNYFAVPHCLLQTAVEPLVFESYMDESGSFRDPEAVLAEFERNDAATDTVDNTLACVRSLGLDATGAAVVTRDLERIFEASAGFGTPAIFADEYDRLATETGVRFGTDFSLFLPRSVYTGSSLRRQYLRTMTWFNQVPFFVRSPELTDYAFAVAELLAADPEAIGDYAKIERSMAFLIGASDDLLPLDYVDAAAFSAQAADPVQAAAEFLARSAAPEIKGLAAQFVSEGDTAAQEAVALTKGMRFFPQRFTLDNYWLSRLTQGDEPPRPGYSQKLPPMASSLEVMGILGSTYAREHLSSLDFYSPDTRSAIDQAMDELTEETSAYTDEEWHRSAYSQWLWTLQSLFGWRDEHIDRLPSFMQSPLWGAKSLQTASASWAELRHATVLHAKQYFAERGGGGDFCDPRPISAPPKGYVEPAIELFDRLESLATKTHAGLTEMGFTDLTNLSGLESFVEAVELSREYAIRQLGYIQLHESIVTKVLEDFVNEDGTPCVEYFIEGASDWEVLRNDILDLLSAALPRSIEGPILSPKDERAALIADLLVGGDATTPQRVLYEGTGVPNMIVAIVDDANGPRAVIGFTYSHYELMPNNVGQSITDEQWQRRFYEDGDESGFIGDPFVYTDRSTWPNLNPWYRPLFAEN